MTWIKRGQNYLSKDCSTRVANSHDELKETILARGFGGITEMDIGPDDYICILPLYVDGGNCNAKFPDIAESRDKLFSDLPNHFTYYLLPWTTSKVKG